MARRSFHGLERLLKARRELMSRQDELLEEFVAKAIEKFPDSTMILFGSRARGQERPDSDYDILVVMDLEDRDRLQKILEIRSLKPRGIPVDVLVLSPEEVTDPLYREMLKGGRVLHNGLGLNLCSEDWEVSMKSGAEAD